MAERENLPHRRAADVVTFERGGREWAVAFGRYADGRVAEALGLIAEPTP